MIRYINASRRNGTLKAGFRNLYLLLSPFSRVKKVTSAGFDSLVTDGYAGQFVYELFLVVAGQLLPVRPVGPRCWFRLALPHLYKTATPAQA